MNMNVTNIEAFIPYAIQFILAIFCVWAIQRLKLYDRFPVLAEETSQANTIASVALALLIAAAFQAKAIYMGWGSGQSFLWVGKDAAVQWGLQQCIYKVGIKDSLKNFFTMLGAGPAGSSKSTVETHSLTPMDDGSTVKVDKTETVIVEPAPVVTDAKK
jgi:hypothetical protein